MFIARTATALTMVLVLSTHLDAQPPDRGRGAFGRRGMMMNDLVFLASLPAVRQELATDEEQEQFLDALSADLRDQQRVASRGFDQPRGGNRPTEDVRSRMQRLSQASEKLLLAVLEPGQVARLEELRVQYEGVRAFDREEFVAALELTEVQQERIRQIRQSTPPGQERRRGDRREARDDLHEEIRGILSDSQRERWDRMQGARFAFPERRGRFGRRGFPGR